MSSTHETSSAPYVGPRPFGPADCARFFGRQQETEILSGLLMTNRTVLLFSPSGAGKTSLIHAGLLPHLTRQRTTGRGRFKRTVQKMEVLPVITGVSAPGAPEEKNPFVFHALATLLPDVAADDLTDMDLAAGLLRYSELHYEGDEPQVEGDLLSPRLDTLLVLDQLEELFAQHTDRWAETEAFFQQLWQAQEQFTDLRILLSMCEEHLAALTPFAHRFGDGLTTRFRLEGLGNRAAAEAISGPAEGADQALSDEVTARMVETLSQPGHGGAVIDPMHLQVACLGLWRGREPEPRVASAALRAFYSEAVAHVAQETGASRRRIRAWVEGQLALPGGARGRVAADQIDALPSGVVEGLKQADLLVTRGDWLELAHDRLVPAVEMDNAAWREQNLVPLLVQATLWDQRGRPDDLLLRAETLTAAEAWAGEADRQLDETDSAFLARCQEERTRRHKQAAQDEQDRLDAIKQERERVEARSRAQKGRVLKIAVVICLVLLVTLAVGWFKFFSSAEEAGAQRAEAQRQEKAARDARKLATERKEQSDKHKSEAARHKAEASRQRALAEKRLKRLAAIKANADVYRKIKQGTGAIACLSNRKAGSLHDVGKGVYLMGLIEGLSGSYKGGTFSPSGWETRDITKAMGFKYKCDKAFAACRYTCWASGDTGRYFGFQ